MKKSLSNEFMEILPRLLQAMKNVNDAGYVGVLPRKVLINCVKLQRHYRIFWKIQKEYQYHRNHMLSLMQ